MGREKSKFSYIWLGCLSLILVLCMFGGISGVKKTYSTNNFCYKTSTGDTCLDLDSTVFGEYNLSSSSLDSLFNYGETTMSLNFTFDGKSYDGIFFEQISASGDRYRRIYFTNGSEKTYVIYCNWDGETDKKTCGFTSDSSYNSNSVMKISSAQTLNSTNFEIFSLITSPIEKCYYNSYSNDFTWTHMSIGGVRSEYSSSSLCSSARVVKLVDNSESIKIAGYTTPHYYFGAKGDIFSVKDYYDNITHTSVSLTRTDYTLTGWNTQENGSGGVYSHEGKFNLNSNLVLYAQWEKLTRYTVTFNANGGTGTMAAQTFVAGQSQKLNANSFTRDGYLFKEWNTKADGSGDSYSDQQSIAITGNKTLYAIWTDKFSLKEYAVDDKENLIFVPAGTDKMTLDEKMSMAKGYSKILRLNGGNVIFTGASMTILDDKGVIYKDYLFIVLGDVSGDGELNTMDYISVYNHLDNSKSLTGLYLKAADMNQDNDITTMDYIDIYNALGGN